ncbi:MAG TPA: hypothetical protein VK692_02430 [Chthoniobacterales bacterium]|jgi:hypothetical protein|nr:hypothetical protein [Chthoniobacterales bacterium]
MAEPEQIPYHAVIALAGRRIDGPETDPPRFPLDHVPIVRKRIADLLSAEHTEALVCSAACGADLIALEEAERLGLRRRIVLPFPAHRFRETSVTDRPGNWGPVFDRLVAAAESAGDLVTLFGTGDDDAAYAAANEAIIKEAEVLAGSTSDSPNLRLVVVIVWEGSARVGTDASGDLLTLAMKAGFEERSVSTK